MDAGAALSHSGQGQGFQIDFSLYRELFDDLPVAAALVGPSLQIVEANPRMGRLLGVDPAELVGRPVSSLETPREGRPSRLELLATRAVSSGRTVELDHRFVHADGPGGWARTRLKRLSGSSGWLACTMEDTTSYHADLEQHRREAELDELTGLLNRRGGDRRLEAALDRMAQDGPLAVILCDIDRFKQVNDTYGHDMGDQVLAGVAARLRSVIRVGDDVSRRGGDEFIAVARVSDQKEAAHIAERFVEAVARPWRSEGPPGVTISVGAAVAHPGSSARASQLLRAADRALYEVKGTGGNGWLVVERVDRPD